MARPLTHSAGADCLNKKSRPTEYSGNFFEAERSGNFSFVVDSILEDAPEESTGFRVVLLLGAGLIDVKYANDVISFSPPAEDMQIMLNRVNDRAGDSKVAIASQAEVGIVFSTTAGAGRPADWIPANSKLRSAHLVGSVKASFRRKTFGDLFIVSVFAPVDYSDAGVKNAFYSDLTVLAGDMNTQIGRLGEAEFRLCYRFGIAPHRLDIMTGDCCNCALSISYL
ncbi:uncharacterized protein DEA37_0004082 [Paragonimus westermani]|uniref:Uncharacterized protein n=1 Tax=Paragonimus westermani TaxID=34504 RepID=A0A5J4NPD0_9TREM|nr:uncharacterized protein DEA37_0004082 [Paragonimus westermani]